jgi:hypothetical protein
LKICERPEHLHKCRDENAPRGLHHFHGCESPTGFHQFTGQAFYLPNDHTPYYSCDYGCPVVVIGYPCIVREIA